MSLFPADARKFQNHCIASRGEPSDKFPDVRSPQEIGELGSLPGLPDGATALDGGVDSFCTDSLPLRFPELDPVDIHESAFAWIDEDEIDVATLASGGGEGGFEFDECVPRSGGGDVDGA